MPMLKSKREEEIALWHGSAQARHIQESDIIWEAIKTDNEIFNLVRLYSNRFRSTNEMAVFSLLPNCRIS